MFSKRKSLPSFFILTTKIFPVLDDFPVTTLVWTDTFDDALFSKFAYIIFYSITCESTLF